MRVPADARLEGAREEEPAVPGRDTTSHPVKHDGVELACLATDDPVRRFLRQGAVVDAALGLDSRPVREDDAAGVDPIRRLGQQVERSEPLRQVPELPLRLAVGRSHEPVERGTLRLGAVFTIGCGDMSISRRGRGQFQIFSDQEERRDDRLARLLASGNENEPPIGYEYLGLLRSREYPGLRRYNAQPVLHFLSVKHKRKALAPRV